MSHIYTEIFRYDTGALATGLSPLIYIRDITSGGTLVVNGDAMTEAGGGWYYYEFDDSNGHVYAASADAGAVAGLSDRYKDGVRPGQYDAELLALDTELSNLQTDMTSALALINSIVKVEYNSWQIISPGVLIFYDNDGVTPIAQYLCYDINGNPATSEIARVVRQ